MSEPSSEHSRMFLAAKRDAHKAWAQTPMLARVNDAQARRVCSTLAYSEAPALADLISDMAGPAVASYALRTSLDADKAQRLSALVMQMFAPACVRQRDRASASTDLSARALAACQAMSAHMIDWIDSGRSPDEPQLDQVDALIGRSPAIRLSLVATAAPVLAHCEVVTRALAQGYPFASRGVI